MAKGVTKGHKNGMIRETLARVLREFGGARKETFSGHPLANWLRTRVPETFEEDFAAAREFNVKASPGMGNWVRGPWIAFLDPIVTETAQEGHYVVYLFSFDMKRVYLSLNQGITSVREEFKSAKLARDTLTNRARILGARVGDEYTSRFDDKPIELTSPKPGQLLQFYECGHAFGKRYDASELPLEEELVGDLAEMLRLYRLSTARGGTGELDANIENLSSELEVSTLEEKRRFTLHRRTERNLKLAREAKRVHGHTCQVCGFNFADRYGALGQGYIEAHHRVPLSQIAAGTSQQLSPLADFAVVCANCHRMLHRKGAPPSFDEFVEAYRLGGLGN